MNLKKFISGISALTIAASAFAGMAVTASAAETTTVAQQLVGHTAIIGTGIDTSSCSDNIYLNSYGGNGGAGELYFKLDNDFDAVKVSEAKLGFRMTSKPNKSRTGTINFYGLSAKTTNAGTLSDVSTDNVKVYVYGGSSTKRYAYSGDTIATYSASASTNSAPKYGEYSYVDITSYIKSLTDKNGGDEVYIGVSISDFAFDSRFGAYGNANPATLDITYTDDEQADYVINYKLNGETIRTDNGTEIVGNTVNLESSFFVDGVKYVLATGEPTTLEVISGGSSLDVDVTVAPTYSYTANATNGNGYSTEIATGANYAGETVKVAYPHYINVDGTLYSKSATSSQYNATATLTQDNQVITVDGYTATEIDNVVFLAEGEDIAGLTASTATNTKIRSSKSGSAYATADTTITNLPAGKYQIYAVLFSASSNGANLSFELGGNNFNLQTDKNSNWVGVNTEELTVTEASDLVFKTSGGNAAALDYIYIVKTGDVPATEEKAFTFGTDGYVNMSNYTGKVTVTVTEDGVAPVSKYGYLPDTIKNYDGDLQLAIVITGIPSGASVTTVLE